MSTKTDVTVASMNMAERAFAQRDALRRPWRAVDRDDWQYINSVIPDGGRGRFWKQVLAEMRIALGPSD